ncbi:PhaM family polyhydroxyalkanoate granule multifunctional regulatory protein [Roseateles sp. So40a]|uniref:PhaM family polyhydroxyalkanoate granule multifunctional regulatory protein n=1 Tax=Roseateles sp. So40a TaxID=3400226 RepID=UPI003A85C89D
MADTDFSKFVPGFDFLQGLMKNAGAAIPGFNQWVAPTLDPAELDKRIDELRTVQFWLENNARLLSATIQSLEVQRMTLSTLHAMNVPMADLKEALKSKVPPVAPAAPSAPAGEDKRPDPSAEKPAGADPLQWWNALTQQFTQVAANAMKTAQTAATAATAATTAATTAAAAASTSAPEKAATKAAAKSTATAAKPRPAAKKAAPARKPAAKRKTS